MTCHAMSKHILVNMTKFPQSFSIRHHKKVPNEWYSENSSLTHDTAASFNETVR